MALWKETPTPATAGPSASPPQPADRTLTERAEPRSSADPALAVPPRRPAAAAPRERVEGGESVIAANLSIEGKIEGIGNVKMAGRFKGDVRIDGNFSIEPGAHLTGQVLAGIVVVGGELQGNIESAKRVDVLEGGVIVGDVKAGSITVAAGSRMRGHVEFGWADDKASKATTGLTTATGTATGVPTAGGVVVGKS
jgi:cytoskeletal protein CcmA (bactofilin family)